MTEIPADVMEAARKVRVDYVGEATGALRPWVMLDALIARAIMAERERCRVIAATYAADNSEECKFVGHSVARLISSPPK